MSVISTFNWHAKNGQGEHVHSDITQHLQNELLVWPGKWHRNSKRPVSTDSVNTTVPCIMICVKGGEGVYPRAQCMRKIMHARAHRAHCIYLYIHTYIHCAKCKHQLSFRALLSSRTVDRRRKYSLPGHKHTHTRTGTLRTLSETLDSGVPVILVKGSGGAADLVSDLYERLYEGEETGGGGERHGSMWLKDVESANKNHVNEYREVMTAWLLKKYQSLYNAFIALDRNKNGVIGPVEFKAAVEEILAESEVTSFFPPKFGEFSGSAPCLHHGKARFGGGVLHHAKADIRGGFLRLAVGLTRR